MKSIRRLILAICLMYSPLALWGQSILKGKVVDSAGEILPGVVVIGQGETVITDADGMFVLGCRNILYSCGLSGFVRKDFSSM